MATQFQAQLPSWLSVQPNMSGLRKYVRDLPSQFDTSGVEANYQGQMQSNVARGTAQAAAAARAAQNRAMRTGGQVASSFAQGSMMMPVMEQNQRMAGDLAQYKGGMQAQQSANRLSAIQAMAQLRAQQAGLVAGFQSDANRLGLQSQQFDANLGLDRDRFGEQKRQFDADFGFRQQQYDDSQDMAEQQLAMQMAAMRKPRGGNYNVDVNGRPMSIRDAQTMAWINEGPYGVPGGETLGGGGGMGFGRTQAPSRAGLQRAAAMRNTQTGLSAFRAMTGNPF